MKAFKIISNSNEYQIKKYENDSKWIKIDILPHYAERFICFTTLHEHSFNILIKFFLSKDDEQRIGSMSIIAQQYSNELYAFIDNPNNHISSKDLNFIFNNVVVDFLPLLLPKDKVLSCQFNEPHNSDIWVEILQAIKERTQGDG